MDEIKIHTPQVALEQTIDSAMAKRHVEIHLLNQGQQDECTTWLGLATSGKTDLKQLHGTSDIGELFTKVYVDGIEDVDPVLLATQNQDTIRYVYLIPQKEDLDFKSKAIWMANIAKSVKSLQLSDIGFYVVFNFQPDEESCDPSPFVNSFERYSEIIRHLIVSTNINKFSVLCSGYSKNTALNLIKMVKDDLRSTNLADITIFH